VWLSHTVSVSAPSLADYEPRDLQYEVIPSEEEVGRAMLQEIEALAGSKEGDLVVIILGGRGAQALHRLLGEFAKTD